MEADYRQYSMPLYIKRLDHLQILVSVVGVMVLEPLSLYVDFQLCRDWCPNSPTVQGSIVKCNYPNELFDTDI